VALPTGMVSFLFTDVVGSSTRWDRTTEAMREAIHRHDEILDAAITRRTGHVVKKMGDGFMAVFADPADAVAAAVTAQRSIQAQEWDETLGGIAVRMGAHTGPADLSDDDYHGPTVNRAARLEAAGHGGQIVVSHATHQLCGERAGVTFRDLGEHHLRGLERPERVFQVEADGLPAEFPPLETESTPTNVPPAAHELIGRSPELESLVATLDEGLLVTITGTGGAGKTTLALEAARRVTDRFPAGVWLVELAGLADGELIAGEILGAIRRPATADRDPVESLLGAVVGQRMLLVLDNCEHLRDQVAGLVDRVLRSTTDVKLLATSREPLAVGGERVWHIPLLSLPTDTTPGAISDSEAGSLFETRAREADPSFTVDERTAPIVHELCQRLDGLPLAIELACARLRSMSIDDLTLRLEDGFKLLRGGKVGQAAHHGTLNDTIAWSYDLLGEDEQRLFRSLSVFAGGFDLEAAESVGGEEAVDVLDQLVAQSLVQHDSGRYRMLETIRQFGAEMLEELGETADARAAHLGWLAALARDGGRELEGRNQAEWLRRFRREIDNIRTGLTWAIEHDPVTGAMAVGALTRFFWLNASEADTRTLRDGRSFLAEGHSLASQLLDAAGANLPDKVRARVQTGIGGLLCVRIGRYDEAVERLTEAEELCERSGDTRGVGWAVFYRAMAGHSLRPLDESLEMYQRARAAHREAGDTFGEFTDVLLIAGILGLIGSFEEGRTYLETYDAAVQESGIPAGIAHADDFAALFDAWQDQVTWESRQRSAAALRTFRRLNSYACLTHAVGGTAMVLARMGDRWAPGVLVGLMHGIRERLNMVLPPYEDRTELCTEMMATVLGVNVTAEGKARDEWERAVAEGRTLEPDEGIDWAIARLGVTTG
jgi:predicted ATPase/class 3 adenylate cyclase